MAMTTRFLLAFLLPAFLPDLPRLLASRSSRTLHGRSETEMIEHDSNGATSRGRNNRNLSLTKQSSSENRRILSQLDPVTPFIPSTLAVAVLALSVVIQYPQSINSRILADEPPLGESEEQSDDDEQTGRGVAEESGLHSPSLLNFAPPASNHRTIYVVVIFSPPLHSSARSDSLGLDEACSECRK